MILALDTSSAAASAALVDAEGVLLGESGPVEGPRQARRVLECVHEALGAAGSDLGDVASIVCGLGPGTFTGLRIGVATARALAQAAGVPLSGVSSLEALAGGLASGVTGASAKCFVPLIDGRRREVFAAVYRRAPERTPQTGGRPAVSRSGAGHAASDPGAAGSRPGAPGPSAWPRLAPVAPLEVVPADALAEFLEPRPGAVVGGDGARAYADRLPPAVVVERAVTAPTALMVARTFLAGSDSLTTGFGATLPVYGREPDAVPR